MLTKFHLVLHRGKSASGPAELDVHGVGDERLAYSVVRRPGFDGSITVRLEDAWRRVIEGRLPRLAAPVTGLETIVKFGKTMQLRESFTVVIEAEFGA